MSSGIRKAAVGAMVLLIVVVLMLVLLSLSTGGESKTKDAPPDYPTVSASKSP